MTEQPRPRNPLEWAVPLPDDEVERALVVTAHPDDADFGAAGTIAGWVDAGIEVTLVLCTRASRAVSATPPGRRCRPSGSASSKPPRPSSG